MDSNAIFLILILAVVVLVPLSIWSTKRKAQFDRKRAIEAQMRQDIIDTRTQKEVAAKLLREFGERP